MIQLFYNYGHKTSGFVRQTFFFFKVHLLADQCLSITSAYVSHDRNSKLISAARKVYPYIEFLAQLDLPNQTRTQYVLSYNSFFRNEICRQTELSPSSQVVNLIVSLQFCYLCEAKQNSSQLDKCFRDLSLKTRQCDVTGKKKTKNSQITSN